MTHIYVSLSEDLKSVKLVKSSVYNLWDLLLCLQCEQRANCKWAGYNFLFSCDSGQHIKMGQKKPSNWQPLSLTTAEKVKWSEAQRSQSDMDSAGSGTQPCKMFVLKWTTVCLLSLSLARLLTRQKSPVNLSAYIEQGKFTNCIVC